jgi:hypothetical protein
LSQVGRYSLRYEFRRESDEECGHAISRVERVLLVTLQDDGYWRVTDEEGRHFGRGLLIEAAVLDYLRYRLALSDVYP